jgi:hypothetical protein
MPAAGHSSITERDLAVLVNVYKYRYLTVTQIARLHFPSKQTAYRRLRSLTELHLLVGFTAPTMTEHMYFLGRPGADLVAGTLDVAVAELGWAETSRAPKDYYFLSHFVQVTDFRITLTRCCAASGLKLLGFIPEYLGSRTSAGGLIKHIKDYVCDIERANEKFNHTPDAVFALEKNGVQALFFLEIDRGTEVVSNAEKGVLKACRFYLNYLVAGGYQRYSKDFGCSDFKGFRALFITTSENRLHNIRQAVTELPVFDKAKKFIWLAIHPEIADTISDKVWRSADLSDTTKYQIG